MKNLKKVLSLVLALAMALSLMTAAFAADASDYKDYSKVTYKEAVDVMTAAGIFNGGDGNNFNPDATLNREQAAKIITYMLVGQTQADKLTTTIAPYSDVAATRCSAASPNTLLERSLLNVPCSVTVDKCSSTPTPYSAAVCRMAASDNSSRLPSSVNP